MYKQDVKNCLFVRTGYLMPYKLLCAAVMDRSTGGTGEGMVSAELPPSGAA